ncbi:MAG: oligopeptide transporter, OPT family [Deltaproteobacteria bacterium]|nr:oligopeptide transporter, OPT family [Deltaproteobacteria bacterium]
MSDFTPYVPEKTDMREFTVRALLLGLVMTVVLGAANAYLGLRAGMTIAATYPAAVVGMAVLRLFKGSVLEENFARTVGSIGESVAAGAIFTIPAFVIAGLWTDFGDTGSYLLSSAMMFTGGILGILFVSILRRVMVEDKDLPFPESAAAAEIHKAGRTGGTNAKLLFSFIGVGALVQLLSKLQAFAAAALIPVPLPGTGIGLSAGKFKTSYGVGGDGVTTVFSTPEIAPAYMGVGYIIGPRLAALNFAGGLLAWGLFVPLLTYFMAPVLAQQYAEANAGAAIDVSTWSGFSAGIWKGIVRPIAVGGMLVGAGFTLYRMRKSLGSGVARAVTDVKKAAGQKGAVSRLDRDLDFRLVAAALGVVVLGMIGLYHLFTNDVGGAVTAAIVMAITGFFFAAVSGFLVGTIGSSNNPVSGLTVSTLIIAGLLMVAIGVSGKAGVATVLGVAAVICTSSAVAGEMLQDLKVGHILGGTPWKMELGNIVGVVFSAALLFFPLMVLHQGDINLCEASGIDPKTCGFGGKNLPAPQAGLMSMLAQGIVDQQMAWPLVVVGIVLGFGLILVQVKSPMLVAVGMYLPLETSFAIFVGGAIRWVLDRLADRKGMNDAQKARIGNAGVLVAAGLIAGEALTGLCIAALAFFEVKLPAIFEDPTFWAGLVVLAVVAFLMIKVPLGKAGRPDEEAPPQAVV